MKTLKNYFKILLFILFNTTLFSQSEWVKIIPDEFYNIYFDSPSSGWVVGNGIIRKTNDGGNTWKTVLSDDEFRLNRIEFGEGGGRGYALSSTYYNGLGNGSLLFSSNGGNSWKEISFLDHKFNDVSIDYDAQIGYQAWFATNKSILYTKSFSNNFSERRNGIHEDHIPVIIKFIEDQIGWVLARGMDNSKDFLYHTTNGGNNWIQINQFDSGITSMRFLLGGTGIISGISKDGEHYVSLTTDFGYNWNKLELPIMDYCRIYDVIKESLSNNIWIAGEFHIADTITTLIHNNSPFYDNWVADPIFSFRKATGWNSNQLFNLYKFCMPTESDASKLFIVGDDIYKSIGINYPTSWISSQFTLRKSSLNDLFFFNTNYGFSVGNHKGIFLTTDSGENWTPVNYEQDSDLTLFKVYFINENKGWACGSKGLIMVTNDGGETWTEINSGAHSELHDIYFVNETRGIAVGGSWASINGGESHFYQSLLTTNDGGYNWEVFEQQVFYDVLFTDELRAIYFIDENEGWIAGGNSIMHTTNAGETWENIYDVPQPAASGPYGIQDLYFSDKFNGIAAGGGYPDNVWRTTDGGNSWLDVTWDNQWSHGGYGIYDVEFASGKFWAVGSDNTYTSNYYGSMWELDYQKGYWPAPNSLFMFDEDNAFISGGRSFARRQRPILTSIEQNHEYGLISVSEYTLSQNYPNPFNPSTSIAYSVPSNEFVSLKVYDILGKEVAVLVNEEKSAGNYEVNFNAENLSSGIYFYVITSSNFSKTNKMILLK